MSIVPGLRSPYAKVGRIVYFGRVLDKIRLHARGALPVEEYGPNLGLFFDARCCSFLRVKYDELKARTLVGDLSDDQLMAWCQERGGVRTDEECEIWNAFMIKRGWRDVGLEILNKRIKENGFEAKGIQTMFDYIEFDEGRDPHATKPWSGI